MGDGPREEKGDRSDETRPDPPQRDDRHPVAMIELGPPVSPGPYKEKEAQSRRDEHGIIKGPGAAVAIEQGDEKRGGHGDAQEEDEDADEPEDAVGMHQK